MIRKQNDDTYVAVDRLALHKVWQFLIQKSWDIFAKIVKATVVTKADFLTSYF